MSRAWYFFVLLVTFACLLFSSCGGGVGDIRVLQTITVTPTEANAPSSGNVRFSAMGTYNKAPMTVDPLQVIWTVGRVDFSEAPVPNIATVNANGVAHCVPGASGTIKIFANAARDPSQPYQRNNFTSGSAELTCP